jgi:hypothetical protein
MVKSLLSLALCAASTFAAALYQVNIIPPPAGPYWGVDGWAINNAGVITGQTKGTAGIFIGTPAGSTVLPGMPNGMRFEINSGNTVANGNLTTSAANGSILFPAGSSVTSINDAGTAAGSFNSQAAIWDAAGNPSLVPVPAGTTYSVLQDINDAGQVTGLGSVDGLLSFLMGTTSGVVVVPIPGLAFHGYSRINQNGDVLGVNAGGTWLLPNGGALIVLPSGANSPTGLNNHRQAVGRSGFGGWIWDEANGLRNLQDLLPAGWTLVSAEGINDAGQIVAQAINSNQNFLTVRLDPVPEPATTVLVAAGLALVCVRMKSNSSL